MPAIQKSSAFSQLNLASVEELNSALLRMGEVLKAQGSQIPKELIDPGDFNEISKELLGQVRDFLRNGTIALPAIEGINSDLSAAPSQDDAIALALHTNLDLDIIWKAAQECERLEYLVLWAEEFCRQEEEAQKEQNLAAIKESVSRFRELKNLTTEQQNLQQRLVTALGGPANGNSFNIREIEKALGVETPKAITRIADERITEGKPDFLTTAQALLKARMAS